MYSTVLMYCTTVHQSDFDCWLASKYSTVLSTVVFYYSNSNISHKRFCNKRIILCHPTGHCTEYSICPACLYGCRVDSIQNLVTYSTEHITFELELEFVTSGGSQLIQIQISLKCHKLACVPCCVGQVSVQFAMYMYHTLYSVVLNSRCSTVSYTVQYKIIIASNQNHEIENTHYQ